MALKSKDGRLRNDKAQCWNTGLSHFCDEAFMVVSTTSSCEGIMPQIVYYENVSFNVQVDGLFLLLTVGVVAVLCVALRKFLIRFLKKWLE